jgi:hypothetical protein
MDDQRMSAVAVLLRDVAEAEDQAAQAFAATLELIHGEVVVRWADPLPPDPGPAGHPITHMPIIDMRYPPTRGGSPPAECWGGARFEWSFGISELHDDRPGEVAFAAGVFVPAHARSSCLDDREWLTKRRAEGFEQLHNVRLGGDQVLRWLDVGTVLAAGEPVEQAGLVAGWIVETFEALDAHRPPAGEAPGG